MDVYLQGHFLYLTNDMSYGHLVEPDNFNTSLIQPDLYEIFNNLEVSRVLHSISMTIVRSLGLEGSLSPRRLSQSARSQYHPATGRHSLTRISLHSSSYSLAMS